MEQSAMSGPHAGETPLLAGARLGEAAYALILVHGRGGTPEGMVPIARAARAIGGANDAAIIAPRAHGNSWYPYRFLAPRADNEPWLSSALAAVGHAVDMARGAGIPADRIVLVGFSQGACLSLEYLATRAVSSATVGDVRLGGVMAMAGALIGDPAAPRVATAEQVDVLGGMSGMPVILACGDADPHIPEPLVRESAAYFAALGARTDLRIYPGVGHDIVGDEIEALRGLVEEVRGRIVGT